MFVSKTSWRRLQDMSSRHLQDMSSRRIRDMSSRRLQRNIFSSSIQDVLGDVFKTSWSRLGRRKFVMLKTCWRRLQDVLKINKCLLGMFFLFPLKWNLNKKYFSSVKTKTNSNFVVKLAERRKHSFLLSIWWWIAFLLKSLFNTWKWNL